MRGGEHEHSLLASMERACPEALLADSSILHACGPCCVVLFVHHDRGVSLFQVPRVTGLQLIDLCANCGFEEGCPKSFFPCRGLQAGLFQVFIGKKPPFVSCTVCQVELTLVSLEMIGEHDCHLSNQHGMVMPCMSGAAVCPFLCADDTTVTKPTPFRCCQLFREGHYTRVDCFITPMGR